MPEIMNNVAEYQTALALHNADRAAVGAGPLAFDRACVAAATDQALWMEANNQNTHTRTVNTAGRPTFANRADAAGVPATGRAENLYSGSGTLASATAACAAWAGSAGHRANMLNPAYTKVGFRCYVTAGGVAYWCAVFSV